MEESCDDFKSDESRSTKGTERAGGVHCSKVYSTAHVCILKTGSRCRRRRGELYRLKEGIADLDRQ